MNLPAVLYILAYIFDIYVPMQSIGTYFNLLSSLQLQANKTNK